MRLAGLALLLALAACERADPPSPSNGTTTRLPPVESGAAGVEPDDAAPIPPVAEPMNVEPVEPAPTPPPAAARPRDRTVRSSDAIPDAYRGRWAESRAHCDRPHERELTVDARRLAFWESEGAVERVSAAGPDALTVRAAFTGEGQSWTREHRLALNESGDRLTVTGTGAAITRVRCR